MASLKIISDSQCDIFIDGDFISNIGPNKLHKVSLEVGEYWVQIVCCSDVNKKYEEIVSLQCDKVIKVDFKTSAPEDETNKEAVPEYDKAILESIAENSATVNSITEKDSSDKKPDEKQLLIVTKDGKSAIFNPKHKAYISKWYDEIKYGNETYTIVKNNGRFGIINSMGLEILPCELMYDDIWISDINPEYLQVEKNDKQGIIDLCGKTIIPIIYDGFMVFSEGLAAVEKDGRYGYIDTSGKTAIPFKYDFAIEFENGYASVSLDGEDQVIDKTGKNVYINRDNYDGVSTIGTNGKLLRVSKKNKEGLVDIKGYTVIPCKYDKIHFFHMEQEPIKVQIGNKYGCYNHDGVEIISCIYDDMCHFDTNHDVTFARLGNKYGLIDIDGDAITPFIYEECEEYICFSDGGLCPVKIKGKFGYINTSGEEVIPVIYDKAEDFEYGYAKTKINNKWNLINTQGEVVIANIGTAGFALSEDMICLKKQGKFGVVDLKGAELVPFIYDEISIF